MIDTAMILAAGRGERLKPITDTIPKSMCFVAGKPLIEHHVLNLKKAGIKKIMINHAYLGYKIRQYLGDGQRYGLSIIYKPEPPGGLETAGGIINALPDLGHKPFLVVNADVFTDFSFKEMMALNTDHQAHLVLIKKPEYFKEPDFGLSSTGQVINGHAKFTFSGIACYHPALFDSFGLRRDSMTPLLRRWISTGKVSGHVYKGLWFDVGSPERLSTLNSSLL